MLDAFETDQAVCKLTHPAGLSVDDEDFEAGIVVQMGVRSGDDQIMLCMLQFRQFLANSGGGVIVNQCHSSHDRRVGRGGLLGDQAITDQIAKGLGTIGVSLQTDIAVKSLEKI